MSWRVMADRRGWDGAGSSQVFPAHRPIPYERNHCAAVLMLDGKPGRCDRWLYRVKPSGGRPGYWRHEPGTYWERVR